MALISLLPKATVVSEPIELIYLSASGGKTIVTYPRTVIVAGKQSQVTVVERYLQGPETGVYFTNAVTEIALAEKAVLDHYKVQNEGSPGVSHRQHTGGPGGGQPFHDALYVAGRRPGAQ